MRKRVKKNIIRALCIADNLITYFYFKRELKQILKESNMSKTLNNSDVNEAKKQVSDLQVVGNGDLFKLLSKASSKREGWMKATKVMQIDGVGCVVQVTTQQGDQVAEALCFVPGVRICEFQDQRWLEGFDKKPT